MNWQRTAGFLLLIFSTKSMPMYWAHVESENIEPGVTHPAEVSYTPVCRTHSKEKPVAKEIPSLAQLVCNKITQVALEHKHTFLKHPYCLTNCFGKPLDHIPLHQQQPIVNALLKSERSLYTGDISIEQALLARCARKKWPAINPKEYDGKVAILLATLTQAKGDSCCTQQELPAHVFEARNRTEELATRNLASFASMPSEGNAYLDVQPACTKQSMVNYIASQARLLPFLHAICQIPADRAYRPPVQDRVKAEDGTRWYKLSPRYSMVTKDTRDRWLSMLRKYTIVDHETKHAIFDFAMDPGDCFSLFEAFALSPDGHYLLHTGTPHATAYLWDIRQARIAAQFKLTGRGSFLDNNKHLAIVGIKEPRTVKIIDYASGKSVTKIRDNDFCDVKAQGDKLITFLQGPSLAVYSTHLLSATQKELNGLSVHEVLCLARLWNILQRDKIIDLTQQPPQMQHTLDNILLHAPHIHSLLFKKPTQEHCTVCAGTEQDNNLFGSDPVETCRVRRLQQEVRITKADPSKN